MSLDDELKTNKLPKNKPVILNVGGTKFTTTVATLTSNNNNFFASMFSDKFPLVVEEDGTIFIDRDGKYFHYILNFLRDPRWTPKCAGLKKHETTQLLLEAEYYQIEDLIKVLYDELNNHKLGYVHILIADNLVPHIILSELYKLNFKLSRMIKENGYMHYMLKGTTTIIEWSKIKEKYEYNEIKKLEMEKNKQWTFIFET
jgi:hypothetical protein